MGGGYWTSSAWDDFSARTTIDPTTGAAKPAEEIFTNSDMEPLFDPKNIKLREACDSTDNPITTPIAIALDVTGSMGVIPEKLIKDGLHTMVSEILNRKPVPGPQIMFMAVGDYDYDRAPLQVTQYESDIRSAEQLQKLFIEGGGGGNMQESYNLPLYFAARKTKIDCFDKRGEKGILFTIGDEGVPHALKAAAVKKFIGDSLQADISTEDLLKMVQERYDVFHLIIREGANYKPAEEAYWKKLLGERAIPVSDYTKVPEIIVSTLEVLGGRPKAEVVASWDGSTALVVKDAISGLTPGSRGSSIVKAGGPGAVWRPGMGGTGGGAAAAPAPGM